LSVRGDYNPRKGNLSDSRTPGIYHQGKPANTVHQKPLPPDGGPRIRPRPQPNVEPMPQPNFDFDSLMGMIEKYKMNGGGKTGGGKFGR